MVGENNELLFGKVVRKAKKNLVSKNVIGIQFEDGMVKDIDFFSKEILEWSDAEHQICFLGRPRRYPGYVDL